LRKIAVMVVLLAASVIAACSDSGNDEILGRWVIVEAQDKVQTNNYFQQRIREQSVRTNFPFGSAIEFMKKGLAHANGISIEYDFPEKGKLRMRTGNGPDTMVDYTIDGDRMQWDYGDVIVTFEREGGRSARTDEPVADDGGNRGEVSGGGPSGSYEPLPDDYYGVAMEAFRKIPGTWTGYAFNGSQKIELTIHEVDESKGVSAVGDGHGLKRAFTHVPATVKLAANENARADDLHTPADAVFETTAKILLVKKTGDDDFTTIVETLNDKKWTRKDERVDLEDFALSFEVRADAPEGPVDGTILPGGDALTGMTKVR